MGKRQLYIKLQSENLKERDNSGEHKRRREHSMEIHKKPTGCEGMDWIILAQAAVKWQDLVKTLTT
jgi:transposase-like protein